MDPIVLVLIAVGAIAILLFTVIKLKWPAFVALLFVAALTALAGGIPLQDVIPLMIEGMGGTLGSVALLVGLGAMLGGIIEKTGGAETIAHAAAKALGEKRLEQALLISSGLVAIPIFFDVAFIILVPIIFAFSKAAGLRAPVAIGMPVAVFMVFIHNAVPPHPGVVGSTTLLGEGLMGMVTISGILLAIPMGFVVYFLGKKLTAGMVEMSPEIAEKYAATGAASIGVGAVSPEDENGTRKPAGTLVIALMLLPILMIAVGTIGALVFDEGSKAANVVSFIGAPALALLVATLAAMIILGNMHGWGRQQIGEVMDGALGPASIVILVTGAGGVFAKVLTETGVGNAVSGLLLDAGVPILLLAFLVALAFKVAQGSGTVATLSAAGIVQGTVLGGDFSSAQIVLIILAIAMGSLSLSHINDSGFWIATKFLGLSVSDGLKTWTVMCTVLGFLGLAILGLAWLIV